MLYLETPPKLIPTEIFSAMPDEFRRKVRTEWADANRPGCHDCVVPTFGGRLRAAVGEHQFARRRRVAHLEQVLNFRVT